MTSCDLGLISHEVQFSVCDLNDANYFPEWLVCIFVFTVCTYMLFFCLPGHGSRRLRKVTRVSFFRSSQPALSWVVRAIHRPSAKATSTGCPPHNEAVVVALSLRVSPDKQWREVILAARIHTSHSFSHCIEPMSRNDGWNADQLVNHEAFMLRYNTTCNHCRCSI